MSMNVYKLPVVGEEISQIGQVVDTISMPCKATPEMLVKASFAAIPTLLWSLYKPELIDVGTSMGGRRHHRKPKFRMRVMGFERALPVWGRMPQWIPFTAAFLQRAGLYLMVIDASTDFVVNWSSMAWRWSGCKIPGQPWAEAKNTLLFIGATNVWWQMPFDIFHDNDMGVNAGGHGINIAHGIRASLAATAEGYRAPKPGGAWDTTGVSVRIRKGTDGPIVAQYDHDPAGGRQQSSTVTCKDWFFDDTSGQYYCDYMLHGPGQLGGLAKGSFSAYGQKTDGIEPDP